MFKVMTSFFESLFCWKTSSPVNDPDEEVSYLENVKFYKYKELRVATKNFSTGNKIGQGGFGSVYEGKLKDGKIAAIKLLSADSNQGVDEFLTEIKAIADIQHENLVKLYGCCAEGDHRILVYNYMENNSLAQTLLGSGHRNHGIRFSWKTRVNICIGIARGLTFLHEEVRPRIVHRDIKASNILLDKDLTPKISDFGLAKLFPDNVTHVSTRVAGTIGYLAPEYAVRGRLTRKADIYSFGVLLAEIVSGRPNINSRLPMGERFILERAWGYYEQNKLSLLVDDTLDGNYNVEEACKYLKIALLCTQDNPKLRPSMSTVVKMLTGVIDISDKAVQKPGLISDLSELKIRNEPEEGKSGEKGLMKSATSTSEYNIFSSSENMDNSYSNSGLFSSSMPSTCPAMSFSSHDRSI